MAAPLYMGVGCSSNDGGLNRLRRAPNCYVDTPRPRVRRIEGNRSRKPFQETQFLHNIAGPKWLPWNTNYTWVEFNSINTTATNVDSMIVLYLSTFKACTRLPPELCLKTCLIGLWDPFSRARKWETVEGKNLLSELNGLSISLSPRSSC